MWLYLTIFTRYGYNLVDLSHRFWPLGNLKLNSSRPLWAFKFLRGLQKKSKNWKPKKLGNLWEMGNGKNVTTILSNPQILNRLIGITSRRDIKSNLIRKLFNLEFVHQRCMYIKIMMTSHRTNKTCLFNIIQELKLLIDFKPLLIKFKTMASMANFWNLLRSIFLIWRYPNHFFLMLLSIFSKDLIKKKADFVIGQKLFSKLFLINCKNPT